MKTGINLLYNLLMTLFIISALSFAGYEPAGAFLFGAIFFLWGFLPVRSETGSVAHEEVLKRIFSNDLQEALYPDNSFYAGAQSDAAGVDVEEIEIPQDEDGEVDVVVNPKKLPLEANVEEDLKKSYSADLLVTKPTIVTYNNQLLVSYDKRAAKLRKHQNSLDKQIAERIMYGWSPTAAANLKETTGGTNRVATAPGATGNRKIAVENDFIDMMILFDKWDIPRNGRRMLAPAELLPDLLAVKKAYSSGTDKSNELMAKGAIMELFTFSVFVRSASQTFDQNNVKKALGSASAVTDNQGILFWHPSFVRYIKGAVKVAMDTYDKPELAHGRSMNALVRGGSTISRLSQIGVAALVEANV